MNRRVFLVTPRLAQSHRKLRQGASSRAMGAYVYRKPLKVPQVSPCDSICRSGAPGWVARKPQRPV